MNNELVDNYTYNLISALAESLQGCQVSQQYGKDGNPELWQKVTENLEKNVQLLQQELSKVMTQQPQRTGSYSATGSMFNSENRQSQS